MKSNNTYITWHPVGNAGSITLWGHNLGDNTVARHQGGVSFVPPQGGETFQADALRDIADVLQEAADKHG